MLVQPDFEKEFETEEYEMLILVQAPCKGVSRMKDMWGGMWSASVDFFASIDLRTGQLFHEKGYVLWLLKDDKYKRWSWDKHKRWVYAFKKFGIYRVTVRKCIPQKLQPHQPQYWNNRYMLINILEKNVSNEKLEALKEHYAKPISIENELGSFILNREFSEFRGIINWNGAEIIADLETDAENGDTAEQAMKVLKRIADNLVDNDTKYREFAAQELTVSANEWMNGTEEITQETFAKRIEIYMIEISSDGSFTLSYSDDDMFYDHVIRIEVESNGEPTFAAICG